MRALIVMLFFSTGAAGQSVIIDDLFVIFNSSKSGADSLLKAKGFILIPVDLKTGKAREASVLWSLHGWCEDGEQTLFEYKHPSSVHRYGFYWNRELTRTEDIGVAISLNDSLGMNDTLINRGLQRIYSKTHGEDLVYTNSTKDFVLIVMPGIGNTEVMVGLFRKDSDLAKRYFGEEEKKGKKR